MTMLCMKLLNHAILIVYFCSLTPGGKYYYRFGDDAYGWSDEFTFNAAPVPGPSVTTKVLAFGGTFLYSSYYQV